MERRNYQPIKFEYFQSDMEYIQHHLNEILEGRVNLEAIAKIKSDNEMKIKVHREEGEWI